MRTKGGSTRQASTGETEESHEPGWEKLHYVTTDAVYNNYKDKRNRDILPCFVT